jgi:hypothetical protein
MIRRSVAATRWKSRFWWSDEGRRALPAAAARLEAEIADEHHASQA